MYPPDLSLLDLEALLRRTPVLAEVHPLVPICLPPDVQIIDDPCTLLVQIDDISETAAYAVLIVAASPELKWGFPQVRCLAHPPVDVINRNMSCALGYMRKNLLTNRNVADRIVQDVCYHQYDAVALLLIDGLSYEDALGWSVPTLPCFVDGPSITYAIHKDTGDILSTAGLAAIIGTPPLAERLYQLGYHSACGYTYWHSRDNRVSQHLFRGIATTPATDFEMILRSIEERQFPRKTYLQIVREGLDGLAHGKRELRHSEICGAVDGIWHDLERIVSVLRSKFESAALYVTADHGILWKNDHDWEPLKHGGGKPRYSTRSPGNDLASYVTRVEVEHVHFYLFNYPYLGAPIRKNDNGTHGGLSYQESIVPFIMIEV